MKTFKIWTVLVTAAGASLLLAAGRGRAGNWPQWRGPTGVGLSDETDLPLTWGGKTNENVLWKVKLEGRGYSSPVVWGDNVFVTTTLPQTDQQTKDKATPTHYVTCYQAADGKRRWRTQVPAGPFRVDNYAVPTPATDGNLVCAWFGSAVLAALDYHGKIVWHKEWPGPFFLNPAMSSSPIVYKDNVILLCEHGGDKDSFLAALDKKTGGLQWELKRPRAGTGNTTPFVIQVGGKPELIVSSPRVLQGIDPDDGKVIWSCASRAFVPSPAYGKGLVYSDTGVDGPGFVVDVSGEGEVSKTKVKWQHPKVAWGYASPIIVGDYVYRATRPDLLHCWKLSTGQRVYAERLEGITVLASPFATPDGRIYLASAGKSYVIKAGPKLEVLAQNVLPAGNDGPSPAVSGGRIFLRSSSELFCIGKK
jgi:outer membrane protein assembly factor BamB